ncbi:MAG: hypothetical protein V3R83_04160, partial [Gammaproteobacteria bacterium]
LTVNPEQAPPCGRGVEWVDVAVQTIIDALILPPINHLAQGHFLSSTRFHGLNQSSSFAAFAQNAFGSFLALSKTLALVTCAERLNSLGGGNFLPSFNRTSMA